MIRCCPMNENYVSLFRELQIPDAIIDCATGKIPSPLASMIAPAEWYCFPPALCPVWCDPSLPYYLGMWKHRFGSRPATFVGFYVEAGKAYEVARTPDQLLCHFILSAIIIHDRVTPTVEQFASAVGIRNVFEIDAVSLKTGDNPFGYSAIPQFKTDLPLASVADPSQYTGSFPTGTFTGSNKWWEESCPIEVTDEVLESWPDSVSKPRWFQPESRGSGFRGIPRVQGIGHGAWSSLNSPVGRLLLPKPHLPGWHPLRTTTVFHSLAKAWTSVAEETSGGY